MKNFIITLETAIIAFVFGIGWYYDKAVNDKEEREELKMKWAMKDAEAE